MLALILSLVLIGVALWLIDTYVPLDPVIRTIIRVVIVLLALVLIFRALGLLSGPLRL